MRPTVLLISILSILVATAAAGEIGVPDNSPTTGAACNAIPWSSSFMKGEAGYQTLLPASMLGGKPVVIKDISFACCTTSPANLVATTLMITIAHTTATALNATWATNLAKDATVVFNGKANYAGVYQTWTPIGLTGKFRYNGTDSLVIEIRYIGATGGFSCYRVNNLPKSYASGAGAFNTTTAGASTSGLKVQLNTEDTNLTLSGSPIPGGTVLLDISAASDAGLGYQVGSSFGKGPIAIGTRKLELSVDPLLEVTVGNKLPTIFVGYAGTLDAAGKAQAKIVLPNDTRLKGLRIYTAFLTLDPNEPFGVASIADSQLLTIQ